MRLVRSSVIAIAICLSTGFAQETAPAPTPASSPNAAPVPKPAPSRDLHLSVVVNGKHDQAAGTVLPETAFTVLDNGVSRPIKSFHHFDGETPVRVLIVVDAVNSRYSTVAYERDQLDKFLTANDGHLAQPTSLAILTDDGLKQQSGSTRDGNLLKSALDTVTTRLRFLDRATGFRGAEECLDLSLTALRTLIAKEGALSGRKLIIFVSPGWALFSGPGIDLSDGDQHRIFTQVVELTGELQKANVTLYSVDPRGTGQPIESRFFYQAFLKGIAKPQQTDFADVSLQVLTTHSGGLVLNDNNDIALLLKRAVDDAADYYDIGFAPKPGEHPNEYHSIEVKVAQPGLTGRTRQGFYTEP